MSALYVGGEVLFGWGLGGPLRIHVGGGDLDRIGMARQLDAHQQRCLVGKAIPSRAAGRPIGLGVDRRNRIARGDRQAAAHHTQTPFTAQDIAAAQNRIAGLGQA